ncbi:30S ribosomal protein S13 [Candidatus Gromoviella agglomerans]|uniref:30S ribosomal protein S13 n=1 Tax=Candidatus Gromoviella agglomerans TaxID=2806609 RepID=UPI001E63A82C|nr:30S ribosomal protein S13 [Candidatus Gromoviella agglomerans]UFX98324.1 30S ribosomal protein S13 [Candidatus Gromoviella agglomerans]
MLIISGTTIPSDKRVEISLSYIYGIGKKTALKIRQDMNLDPSVRIKDLTNEQIIFMRSIIDNNYKVGGDLRTQVRNDIRRLIDIGCYRGLRHIRGLPCRGQRTHTNAKTRRSLKTI